MRDVHERRLALRHHHPVREHEAKRQRAVVAHADGRRELGVRGGAGHHHRLDHRLEALHHHRDHQDDDALDRVGRPAGLCRDRHDRARDNRTAREDHAPAVALLLEDGGEDHRREGRRRLDHLVDEQADERQAHVVRADVDARRHRERDEPVPVVPELLEVREARLRRLERDDDEAAQHRREHVPHGVEDGEREMRPIPARLVLVNMGTVDFLLGRVQQPAVVEVEADVA
mmetsp:Transcript_51651/g.135767  ORF Transcript_51651/g.135767 Transcript_51651/m.135767 type:complete len:230 (-) Transcript_51651:77-766(-)